MGLPVRWHHFRCGSNGSHAAVRRHHVGRAAHTDRCLACTRGRRRRVGDCRHHGHCEQRRAHHHFVRRAGIGRSGRRRCDGINGRRSGGCKRSAHVHLDRDPARRQHRYAHRGCGQLHPQPRRRLPGEPDCVGRRRRIGHPDRDDSDRAQKRLVRRRRRPQRPRAEQPGIGRSLRERQSRPSLRHHPRGH